MFKLLFKTRKQQTGVMNHLWYPIFRHQTCTARHTTTPRSLWISHVTRYTVTKSKFACPARSCTGELWVCLFVPKNSNFSNTFFLNMQIGRKVTGSNAPVAKMHPTSGWDYLVIYRLSKKCPDCMFAWRHVINDAMLIKRMLCVVCRVVSYYNLYLMSDWYRKGVMGCWHGRTRIRVAGTG